MLPSRLPASSPAPPRPTSPRASLMGQADLGVEPAAAEAAEAEVVVGAGQAVGEAVLVGLVADRAKPTRGELGHAGGEGGGAGDYAGDR